MSRQLPQFGAYEAIRRLGAGGMAETFVALRRGPSGFEQKVCIKRVLPAYADDREFIEGFLREARTSAALRHTNIAQVVDFGIADDSYYLALELIEGVDLRALLSIQGEGSPRTLPSELTTLIAGELASALDHAHAGSAERVAVVHRDVSPSNVLISPAGEVKLTDFGIARALGGSHLTATGVIKGKIPYLPPEYIERGQFDARSDLFSLGVLLFEMLVGERPFDGESDLDTIRRIVAGERPKLADAAPQVAPALAACVEQLITTDPDSRFPSARALLEALPSIATHAARRELGGLVEQRLRSREPSGPVLQKPLVEARGYAREQDNVDGVRAAERTQSPDVARERTLPAPQPVHVLPTGMATQLESRPAVETRTRRQPLSTRTAKARQRSPIVALAIAGAAFGTLLAGLAMKSRDATAGASTSSPPKALPVIVHSTSPAVPKEQQSPLAAFSPEEVPHGPTTSAPSVPPPEKPQRPNPSAEIRVVVIPFGEVWIDGKSLGHAPVSLKLAPGSHDVGVGDGRPEEHRTVQLHAGEHEKLVFRRDRDNH